MDRPEFWLCRVERVWGANGARSASVLQGDIMGQPYLPLMIGSSKCRDFCGHGYDQTLVWKNVLCDGVVGIYIQQQCWVR